MRAGRAGKKPEAKAKKKAKAKGKKKRKRGESMPVAGRDPGRRALAHYQWAGRYDREDADAARVRAHLDRAAHYMRVAAGSRTGTRKAAASTWFGVGEDQTAVPDSVMIGIPADGKWFPARPYQIWAADELMDWELRRLKDSVIHYNEGGVVMSCYRSPLTGGVYLYTYPVEQTSPESDATVRSLVNSSIQRNNSRGLIGVNRYVRIVEDWRKDMLQIHLDDGWFDARPYQKFAYFDFMLRTKGAGSRVVYRTQEHRNAWGAGSVDSEEEVLIPALYYDKGQDIALTMERDATDPAAVYMIRFHAYRNEETAVRYRMSDSALVKAHEAGVDKATRQRRPSASAGGGGGGGSGASGSSAKKPKPAKWADVKTVAEAYAMLDIAMGPGAATKEEADLVKKAHREHAKKLHPDKGGEEAEFKAFGRAMNKIRDERFGGTDWLNVNYFGAVY